MRLPVTTREQKQREDSRQFNEVLYQAFLDGQRVSVVVSPHTAADEQLRLASNGRQFWFDRGFQIRTQIQEGRVVLHVWLIQTLAIKQEAAA